MLFFHFKVQKNLQSTELDSHVEAYISRIRSKQSQIGLVKADILSSTGHHVRSGSLPNFQNPDCPETGRFSFPDARCKQRLLAMTGLNFILARFKSWLRPWDSMFF